MHSEHIVRRIACVYRTINICRIRRVNPSGGGMLIGGWPCIHPKGRPGVQRFNFLGTPILNVSDLTTKFGMCVQEQACFRVDPPATKGAGHRRPQLFGTPAVHTVWQRETEFCFVLSITLCYTLTHASNRCRLKSFTSCAFLWETRCPISCNERYWDQGCSMAPSLEVLRVSYIIALSDWRSWHKAHRKSK